MDCASCAANIEYTLKKEKGVSSAAVNFASGKAIIEFDEKETNLEKIQKVIKDLGYGIGSSGEEEIRRLKNTFIFSAVLGLPIFYLVMAKMLGLPLPSLSLKTEIVIQFLITTAVMAVNYPLYVSGLKKLIRRSPNMDSLIQTGTMAAYFYSVAVSLLIWLEPDYQGDHLYYESAALILVFISLGKYLEALTKGKTAKRLKNSSAFSRKRPQS